MDGTATQHSIPAHSLAPGRNYQCQLTFSKTVDTDTASYAGVTAAAIFASVTHFELTTTGNPIMPSLEVVGFSNGQFLLRIHGEFRRVYSLQQSQNFTTWQDVYSSNADAASSNSMGTADLTDFGSSGQTARFYRAIEGFSNQGQGGSN